MSSSGHVFSRIKRGSKSSFLIQSLIGDRKESPASRTNTVGGLKSAGMKLVFTCGTCRHAWDRSPDDLLDLLAPETPLKEVRQPCPACGSGRVSTMPVSETVPG